MKTAAQKNWTISEQTREIELNLAPAAFCITALLFIQLCSLGTYPSVPGVILSESGLWGVLGKPKAHWWQQEDNSFNFLLFYQQHLSTVGQKQHRLKECLTLLKSRQFSISACTDAVFREIFYTPLGRCFQVCWEDHNIPGLLLRSCCVADKVTGSWHVWICFIAAFEAFRRWVVVSLLISRCLLEMSWNSYPRHWVSTGWQQFQCCFRCFYVVLSNCVFYEWVGLEQPVSVVKSLLGVISLDSKLTVSLKLLQEHHTLLFPVSR